MFVLETFDEELYERDLKTIAYEDGLREGKEEGLREGLREGLHEGELSGRASMQVSGVESITQNLNVPLEQACKILGITVEEYQKAIEVLKKAAR